VRRSDAGEFGDGGGVCVWCGDVVRAGLAAPGGGGIVGAGRSRSAGRESRRRAIMIVILLLIPLSILLAVCFLGAFIWAVRSGQYEDTCTPSMRLLMEEQRVTKAEAMKPTDSQASKNEFTAKDE
jgi:cbb3-type cytochrome oxidase maturation protein